MKMSKSKKIETEQERFNNGSFGLTKLEYFSALAMQGILSRTMFSDKDNIAEIAVESAKALIDELNKEEGNYE